MLSRLLDRWKGLSIWGAVAAPRAFSRLRDGFRAEKPAKTVDSSWVWEAKLTVSRTQTVPVIPPTTGQAGQNIDMSENLNDQELNILAVLNEAYPGKLHLHALVPRTGLSSNSTQALRVVDNLLTRGLVEGKALRGSDGLADAADLLITQAGVGVLNRSTAVADAKSSRSPLKAAQASVLNVLIASPSDVPAERDVVVRAIHEWNANHYTRTGIMLHPVRWETHSYPAAGDRPQGLVNKQIVESAHFLIAIFGNRLGSPTGEAESGTLEEIDQFRDTGRHVALYFSNAPVARSVDKVQLAALQNYQEERKRDSLFFTYENPDDLGRLVTNHLPKIVAEVQESMRTGAATPIAELKKKVSEAVLPRTKRLTVRATSIEEVGELSPKEIELLWNAVRDPDGDLLHSETLDGEDIRTNGRHFLDGVDRRTAAEWLTAFRSLGDGGLIEPLSDEHSFFKVTGEGYVVADEFGEFASWDTSSVTLRAFYMNAESEEIAISCKRVVAIPATYYADQVGADQSIMRSLKERRSLLVEGVKAEPNMSWEPTNVEFTETSTDRVVTFRVERMTFVRPGTLKLPITG